MIKVMINQMWKTLILFFMMSPAFALSTDDLNQYYSRAQVIMKTHNVSLDRAVQICKEQDSIVPQARAIQQYVGTGNTVGTQHLVAAYAPNVYQPATTNPGGPLADKIERYSRSPYANSLVKYMDRIAVYKSSQRKCVPAVQLGLMQSSATLTRNFQGRHSARSIAGEARLEDHYLSAPSAPALKAQLDQSGKYINLLDVPYYRQMLQVNGVLAGKNAPRGTVLIWSYGGKSGHAAVRTDQGIKSDYSQSEDDLMSNGFKLIGAYIPDMDKF